MAIVETHRGPVSGLTHVHLLRESAAERAERAAATRHDDELNASHKAEVGEHPALTEQDPKRNSGR